MFCLKTSTTRIGCCFKPNLFFLHKPKSFKSLRSFSTTQQNTEKNHQPGNAIPILEQSDLDFGKKLKNAFETVGFAYIHSKQFTRKEESSIFETTKQLFDSNEKTSISTNSKNSRGYYHYSGVGINEIEQKELNSTAIIEAFQIGSDQWKSNKQEYYQSIAGDFDDVGKNLNHKQTNKHERLFEQPHNWRSNQWPRQPLDFKNNLQHSYSLLSDISNSILKAIDNELPLQENRNLSQVHSKRDFTMEIKRYNKQKNISSSSEKIILQSNTSIDPNLKVDDNSADTRVKAHVDLSTITLLVQDQIGGLQILHDSLGWIDAPALVDEKTGNPLILVNSGEVLKALLLNSNVRIKSVKHRVVRKSTNVDRFSCVLFVTPNWETKIDETTYFGDMIPF